MCKKRANKLDTNVFCIFRQREYGLVSNTRVNVKVVKRLVCKKGSTFKKLWQQSSNQAIAYEDGRIYFNNYRKCYTTYGKGGLPHLLFTLPRCQSSEKIEEGLVCHCPLAELPLEHRGYRPHFLALHANNWLVRYDLLTGQVLQKVFLTKHITFRTISWDVDQTRIVVKSKLYQKQYGNRITEDRLVNFCMFSVFPLEFIGFLDVTRSVFGTDIVDALIAMGLLIVMHQNHCVRFYSIASILEAGLQFPAPLEHHCHQAGGVVGTQPIGVPHNIRLTERPAVLFEVKCDGHNVNIGGNPWHYIVSPVGESGYVFNVHALKDHKEATRGSLCMGRFGVEQDKCFFHADNSGRILHIGQNKIRVLRLTECESGNGHQVETMFSVDATSLNKADRRKIQKGEVRYTSSGRAVRQCSSYGETVDEQRQIVDVDYEDELDLLAVTALDADGNDQMASVHLINNQTGRLMAQVRLEESWKDYLDHDIAVDMDTLVHIVRGGGMCHCYLYRLDRKPEETEAEVAARPRTQKNTGRRHVRQSVT